MCTLKQKNIGVNVNPVGPCGCYDEAKRFMEAITMAYHETHGLETRNIRILIHMVHVCD